MQHPLTLSLPSSVTFQVPLFFKDASFFSFVFVCWLLSQSTTNNVKIRVFLLVLGLGYLLLNLKFFLLLLLKKNSRRLVVWISEAKKERIWKESRTLITKAKGFLLHRMTIAFESICFYFFWIINHTVQVVISPPSFDWILFVCFV